MVLSVIPDMNPKSTPSSTRSVHPVLENLSDLELIQHLLGTRKQEQELSHIHKYLEVWDSQLPGEATWKQWRELGLSYATTIRAAAAWELSRRKLCPRLSRITSPEALFTQVVRWAERPQEVFLCATLNGAQELIRLRVITIGLVNRTLVHPREVFAPALSDRSAGIIVAHNHPSGQLQPSREDLEVTMRLKQAGDLLGIPLLDHLIFSRYAFVSLKQLGHLP